MPVEIAITRCPRRVPMCVANSRCCVRKSILSKYLLTSPTLSGVLNEMGCSISRFGWDAKNGLLEPHETISALPAGVEVQKNFTAAEILVHPSGKFVYATLRGHDSVSVFSAKKSGKLTFVQNISCGGKVPRGLGIDPTGRWLFTGNQKSDNAVEFSIEAKTGKLAATGAELKIGSPVDVKFVAVE